MFHPHARLSPRFRFYFTFKFTSLSLSLSGRQNVRTRNYLVTLFFFTKFTLFRILRLNLLFRPGRFFNWLTNIWLCYDESAVVLQAPTIPIYTKLIVHFCKHVFLNSCQHVYQIPRKQEFLRQKYLPLSRFLSICLLETKCS